jgi:hypothetical protein
MMCLWASYKKKNMKKIFFFGILKIISERNQIRSWIRIRTKMSRFPNTDENLQFCRDSILLLCTDTCFPWLLEGITHVIDSCFVKLAWFNTDTYNDSLIVTEVSQASAEQRAGRAGEHPSGKFTLEQEPELERNFLTSGTGTVTCSKVRTGTVTCLRSEPEREPWLFKSRNRNWNRKKSYGSTILSPRRFLPKFCFSEDLRIRIRIQI